MVAAVLFADCYYASYNQCLTPGPCQLICSADRLAFDGTITDTGTHSYVYPSGDPNQGLTSYTTSQECTGTCAGSCPICSNYYSSNPKGSKNQWTDGQCCPVPQG